MRVDIHYKCDEKDVDGNPICNCTAEFKSYKKARDAGWGLGKNYSECWCPVHAPAHRKGGAKQANIRGQKTLQKIMRVGL